MATIYAVMESLEDFNDRLLATLSPLRTQSLSKEDLIDDTIRQIEVGIIKAEDFKASAYSSLQDARRTASMASRALDSEISRVNSFNANRPSDTSPIEVASFYFSMAQDAADDEVRAERDYDYATDKLNSAYRIRSDFDNYVRRFREEQEELIHEYAKALTKSDDFIQKYVEVLMNAKKAIMGISEESEGSTSGQGSAPIGARPLTTAEAADLSTKTGWPLDIINQKCSIYPDGTIYYNTTNSRYANSTHPRGVYFEVERVSINGVTVEGVFPKYDAFFEPPIMPKELWNSKSKKYADQFKYCDKALKQAVNSSPALAAMFTPVQLQWINAGETPPGFTWHHHQQPGKMQLVRKQDHNPQMHGAAHIAGALWCI